MSGCVFNFSKAALVILDEIGVLELLPLDTLCVLDGSGEGVAWETRLKGGFTVIGVKAGFVFGIMRKSGRVWAS